MNAAVTDSGAVFPAAELYVASLLANFFEAGWAIQVLVGDASRAQYEASRLARPAVEQHLRTMTRSAQALPPAVREHMPKVDWQSWGELGALLPPRDEAARTMVWTVIDAWLPPAGRELRFYRRQLPWLWQFRI